MILFGSRGRFAVLMAALMVSAPALAQEDTDKKKDEWQVATPPLSVRGQEVSLDVREGTWMSLDVSPDGKTLAFDLLGDIYLLPMDGGKARAIASGVQWDMQPRFSPDGARIAFTSDRSGGDNIWVMNTDGSEPSQITDEKFTLLNNPAWSPDGSWLAARKHFTTTRSLGTGEIWLYHAKSGATGSVKGSGGVSLVERPSKKHQKELGEPMFAPDGEALYYTLNSTPGSRFEYAQDTNREIFQIRKVTLATGEIETVAGGPGGAVRAAPSPDGRYLAFVRRVRAQSRLFVKDLVSGDEVQVFDGLDQDMQETWAVQGVYPNMDWTPDSRHIVFWAKGKIHKLTLASGAVSIIPFEVLDTRTVFAPPRLPVDVSPDMVETKMPRWAARAPGGEAIVFQSLGYLYIKKNERAEPVRLTKDKGTGFELFPAFSPDGKSVYFTTWDDKTGGTVRRVSVRGGKSKVLTSAPGHYREVAVSQDGKTLAFRMDEGGYLLDPRWSTKPGIYVMPVASGLASFLPGAGAEAKPRFVTSKGSGVHFGPEVDRLYVMRRQDDKTALVSLTFEGHDARTLATSQFGREIKISPTGPHVAYIENYHVYVAPLPRTGKAIELKAKGAGVPVTRLSVTGGAFLSWAGDGSKVSWSIGPQFKTVALDDMKAAAQGETFKGPDTGVSLSVRVKAERPDGLVALTGARLITMRAAPGDAPFAAPSEVIEDGVIVIEGNRIKAVGSRSEISVPNEAQIVDVSGKTIIPGLIDIHAHGAYGQDQIIPKQNWSAMAHLALGVTTLHDPSSRASMVFPAAEMQAAGLVLAPRIFSTGEIVYGAKSGSWAPIDSLDDARAHVRRLKVQGALSIKNYNQPRRDQRQQVIEAARLENIMVVAEGGSLFHMDLNMVVDGNTGIEHTLPNQDIYEDVLQLWSQTKVGYTPTLVVGFGTVRGEDYWYDKTEVWKHPILSSFVPPKVLQPRSVRRQKAPDADYRHRENAAMGKKLADRGVSVHTGAHGQREGLGSHWEMWMFAQGGMSVLEALRAATLAPAQYLGLDGDIGSLEPGKLADLVVLDGDILADITASDQVSKIMLNGRLYEAATLDEVVTGTAKTQPFYWQGRPESQAR